MIRSIALVATQALMLGLLTSPVRAQDPQAGKRLAEEVCAACHGASGISVSDTIPNLAGQRHAYLENQLKALRDGTRKSPVMNAIASQLSLTQISDVAVFFSGLTGASGAAKSAPLPSMGQTRARFPENHRATHTHYLTINFPATRQVRYYFANTTAIEAARSERSLPDGSALLVEVWSAQLDTSGNPITGPDGFYTRDRLLAYTAMQRESGWGQDIAPMLRNEDWHYATFTADGKPRANANQAECLACHKPLERSSFLFTLKHLAAMR